MRNMVFKKGPKIGQRVYEELHTLAPSSDSHNCFTGLMDEGPTMLGYNKKGNYVHFFQKPDKNSIREYTGTSYLNTDPNAVGGMPFEGQLQVRRNKYMKKRLSKLDEIYHFKTKASAKRFRDMLKAFD